MAPRIISIIGGLDADLIMVTNRVPEGGESMLANNYHEALGGKGANSAIATYRTCHKRPPDTNDNAEAPGEPSTVTTNHGIYASLEAPVGEDDDDIQVRMVGAVGDDKYADLFHIELNKNGVDTSGLVKIRGKRSSVCFVIVENYTGENRCLFSLGATEAWTEEDFMEVENLAHGPRPDLVIAQMEIRKEVVQQMIETAAKAGIDFLLNAAPAHPITLRSYSSLTHLLVNETEAAIMSGRDLEEVHQGTWPEIAQEFVNRGVKNVVITLGAQGAYYATATDSCHVPGYKVTVVDSTGAGSVPRCDASVDCSVLIAAARDTFTGAYASEYLRQKTAGNWDIKRAIIHANKAAALTIGKLGAQAGIPWADDIDQFEAELNITKISEINIDEESPTDMEKVEAGNEVIPPLG